MASPAIKYTCGDAGMTTPASKFVLPGAPGFHPSEQIRSAGMQGCGAQASLQVEARQRDAWLPRWM